MNNDWIRLITTGIIWTAAAGIIIAGGFFSDEIVPLTFIMGVGATISTGFIWVRSDSASDDATKAKRDNRVSRLVDKLDEDEVLELAELLDARREDRLRK